MFDKLAEELKEARLKSNITIKQLSTRTRIDIKFIEAMEEGNFGFLPELYVKAFVREYANVVGLNPDIILKKYDAAKEGLPYEETAEDHLINTQENDIPETAADKGMPASEAEEKKPENKPVERTPKFREVRHSAHQSNAVYSKPPVFDSTTPKRSELLPGNKNNIIIGAAVGAVLILFGLIYILFFNSSSEIVVTEKPYDQVVSESRQRYEEVPANKADSVNANSISEDSLNLLIQTTDTSWVRLILDNTKVEEFILFPNSQKFLKAANNFKITFGRSSAIKLLLNNKPLPFNPPSKSVSHVKINLKGLEYLQSPPQAGQE